MARQLKSDLNVLKDIFTDKHERFRILNVSSEELNCRFVLKDGSFCDIQAIFTMDMYPSMAPLWCVTNEDETITNALEALSNTSGRDNNIINQVKILLHQLCTLIDVPVPKDLDNLGNNSKDQEMSTADCDGSDKDTGNGSDEVSDNEDENQSDDEDDDPFAKDESDDEMMELDEDDLNMDVENAIVIKKQSELQYNKAHNTNQSGSKILLKELKTIYNSDTYKTEKTYKIELINDSIYDWSVSWYSVCPDSLLNKDLAKLKQSGGKDYIEMRVMFKETYPFDPPFIQVTYPAIKGGHVLDAGALCMELLTKQGWSSAYSMENVFVQISSTFITGNARVDFELTKTLSNRPYSLEAAKRMFQHHEDHHAKNGWVTPANQNS